MFIPIEMACLYSGAQAQYFCCEEGCNHYAFGCHQYQCFRIHQNHEIRPWQPVRNTLLDRLNRLLFAFDLQNLQSLQSNLKSIQQQLGSLMNKLQESINLCRSGLKIEPPAQLLIDCMKGVGNRQQVTGGIMFQLLEQLGNVGHMYANQTEVREEIAQTYKDIDAKTAKLKKTVEEFQKILKSINQLRAEKEAQQMALKPILIELHPQSLKSQYVEFPKENIFTVKPGKTNFHPIFLKQPLTGRHIFKVKVCFIGQQRQAPPFMIGLAPAKYINKAYQFQNKDIICFSLKSRCVYFEGAYKHFDQFMIVPDEVIEVRVDLKERIVEWENNKKCVAQVSLTEKDREPLYPVCWICTNPTKGRIPKLCFI